MTVNFKNSSEGPVSSAEWDFGDGTNGTGQNPDHLYTVAGTYTVKLTASGPGGNATWSDLITVKPGPPVSLEVSPPSATITVQEGRPFTAVAKDEFGNVAPGVATWTVAGEGGSIADGGLFTAGKVAGTFPGLVKASFGDEPDELVATALVVVAPGEIAKVVLEPAEVTLDIGSTQAFSLKIFDGFDNEIPEVLASWNLEPDVGILDDELVFVAGTRAGEYPRGIVLELVKGSDRGEAEVDLSIRPDPLATIEIEPSIADFWSTQRFKATAFDQYGNAIPGLAFLWESDGGEITPDGRYTASEVGSFPVTASATFKGTTRSGSAVAEAQAVVLPPSSAPTAPSFGGLLRIATEGSVQSFDPLWTTASATGNVSSTVLEALFASTRDLGIGPVLMDSWTSSTDGLTWTFNIRDEVKFHDGTPLTTDQVIGTLGRQKDRAPVFKLVWEEFGPEAFEDFITKDDDLSFTMHLNEPTLLVLNALGPQNLTPQVVTEDWYTIPATGSAEGPPNGTGP